jgi:hypothetical protein
MNLSLGEIREMTASLFRCNLYGRVTATAYPNRDSYELMLGGKREMTASLFRRSLYGLLQQRTLAVTAMN